MEGEVKEIQMELAAIRRDRMNLHALKPDFVVPTSLKLVPPAQSGLYQQATRHLPLSDSEQCKYLYKKTQKDSNQSDNEIMILFLQDTDVKSKYVDEEKIREDDIDYRIPQIAKLREELIRAKNAADEERLQREKYEGKLKDLEVKLNGLCNSTIVEDYRKKSNEELSNLKKQLRDASEEIEEMKITITEKNEQLQEYRLKYLQAQQQVEEYKRQLDLIEYDNKQVSDQIQIEIQKMKMQFQEKLQDLAPLPDLLKGAQIQLQEARQLQKLAEDNTHEFSNELHRVKEKLVIAVSNLNQEKAERTKLIDENKAVKSDLEEKRMEVEDLNRAVDDLKCNVLRLEEKLTHLEARYKEKATECANFLKEIDECRNESSRAAAKTRERSESMRRYMQTQISELERQLIQSRAQCRACLKERDDIRQRMQIQVTNLQENFDMVEIRLRTLQNQIASLKSSYAVILANEEDPCEINMATCTCD
ncbi:unnamed protein product [Leptosia nina]|uniref:Uncharacterized protein n=1 Tax=Leptosia nina TaxID=320188 RepID=A0AAV1K351_9NEOP